MLKETFGVLGADRIERLTDRLYPSASLLLTCALRRRPLTFEKASSMGGLFDGAEVWRVRWQVERLTARALNEFPDPLALVGRDRLSITTNCLL